jgi:hypothetical protein
VGSVHRDPAGQHAAPRRLDCEESRRNAERPTASGSTSVVSSVAANCMERVSGIVRCGETRCRVVTRLGTKSSTVLRTPNGNRPSDTSRRLVPGHGAVSADDPAIVPPSTLTASGLDRPELARPVAPHRSCRSRTSSSDAN